MLDFGLLPPEVNSGRMYSGPGPGPLLAASEAWDSLAAELGFAASGYGSALAELTSNSWVGPTSAAMISAATPYINWLTTTAHKPRRRPTTLAPPSPHTRLPLR